MKPSMLIQLAIFWASAMLATPVFGQEITEILKKPIRATLMSANRPESLELCVADAISQIGGAVPVPIRNGADDVMMLGYGHTPKIVISLDWTGTETRIEIRTRSGDMDDKLVRQLKQFCAL